MCRLGGRGSQNLSKNTKNYNLALNLILHKSKIHRNIRIAQLRNTRGADREQFVVERY